NEHGLRPCLAVAQRTPTTKAIMNRALSASVGVTIDTVTSLGIVFRSKAEQKVEEAGYDPKRLPPGQYLTEKWPVLHAGSVPETNLATWDFRVFGDVGSEVSLSYDELRA